MTCDLSRQVKMLLFECEAARGDMVLTSHDDSADISSTDISGSSQVGMTVINLYLYEFCLHVFLSTWLGFAEKHFNFD